MVLPLNFLPQKYFKTVNLSLYISLKAKIVYFYNDRLPINRMFNKPPVGIQSRFKRQHKHTLSNT